MSESGKEKSKIDYPATLDAVHHLGRVQQVVSSVQTGDKDKDRFLLRNPNNEEFTEVNGGVFKRYMIAIDPKDVGVKGLIHQDQGVMITGNIQGGKFEKIKPRK